MAAEAGLRAVATPKGTVRLEEHATPERVLALELDSGLGVFPQYRSILHNKRFLARVAGLDGGNLVLSTRDGLVVGYCALGYAGPDSRWGRAGGLLYELGSIEVSRNWRRLGLARAMVALALEGDWVEDKILYLTGFAWHWDLESTGLPKHQYRNMLTSLFLPFGFRPFYTNEPNVSLDPANILLARMGQRVSFEARELFMEILFGKDGEAY